MVIGTWLAILHFAFPRAQDEGALAQIQTMLARPAAMCGAFVQKKSLVGLRRPVLSSGRFCMLPDRGVLWSTELPFLSTLRLTHEEIVESQGERVTSRLSASKEPTVGVISELLYSVLAGDFQLLRNGFAITASVASSTWNARLVPKSASMRRVIDVIELTGADFVREITITDASGDRTSIAFAGIVAGASALTPDEARVLGRPSGLIKPPR